MGEVFYNLNLLPSADVIDIGAQELVTGYVGQAGKKTAEILHKARGKVLFIDEAYQLNPRKGGQYMQEVVDEIVKSLTSPEIRGNMVLILAGYESDINEMLTVNQGLRSRISKKIQFPDFSTEKICQLLQSELQKNEFRLNLEATSELPRLANILRSQPGFSNGRDVETLSRKIITNTLYHRNSPSSITLDVLEIAFAELLVDIQSTTASNLKSDSFSFPSQMMSENAYSSPPPMNIAQRTAMKKNLISEPIENIKSEPEDVNQCFLKSLQAILDQKGLNSKEGIQQLLNLSIDELEEFAIELSESLDLDVDTVKEMIREWQQSQRNMLTTLDQAEKELEEMKKTKKRGRVPIWRCGVCGRADQTYIACYVAPYVVRYEERDLN